MDVISLEENLAMRKNNTLLAAAIAATFVASMNVSYAGIANYPLCPNTAPPVVSDCNTAFPDPNIGTTVVPIVDNDQGIIYGTHLFGGGSSIDLPSDDYAAVKWTIEGTPKGRMQITATLAGADFNIPSGTANSTSISDYPQLVFSSSAGSTSPLQGIDYTKNCSSSNSCIWSFGDAETSLANSDAFYIVYKLTNAGSTLATDGGKVTMTVKAGTNKSNANIILAEKDVTVATSKEPFTVDFVGTNNINIKVSVAADNKKFITSATPDKELISPDQAIFGYMKVTPSKNVRIDNGYTPWMLGASDKDTLKVDAGTTLTIDDIGQFAASTGGNGKVELLTTPPISAIAVSVDAASWNLTDTDMASIFKGTGTITDSCSSTTTPYTDPACIPIAIKADGTNQINIPDGDGPKAVLNLSYKATTSVNDIKYPAGDVEQRLTKYSQDGISCWVFNVPFAGAIDQFNMRIFNDSSTTPLTSTGDLDTECVQGTLYGPDGAEIGKEALGCPPAGGALYIGTNEMATIFSGFPTTVGRGTMFITSTLQKMEVLAMTRFKAPPCKKDSPDGFCGGVGKSPLTNISTGAHGVACAPNYR